MDALESAMATVLGGRMPRDGLRRLDVDFDNCPSVHGGRLSFLRRFGSIESLRLRGFDLSTDGMNHLRDMTSLRDLHLCHGNHRSFPSDELDERNLLHLGGLANHNNLRRVHLENVEGLSELGLGPFCAGSSLVEHLTLRHCRGMRAGCTSSIGRMSRLRSLHVVGGPGDDPPAFGTRELRRLGRLTALRSLSLFHVLEDPVSNLVALRSLTALETLNIGVDEDELVSLEEFADSLCAAASSAFSSLSRLRIYTECSNTKKIFERRKRGKLEVECCTFIYGDAIDLD